MSTVYDRFRASALQRGDADFLCVEEVTAANYGIEAQTISWRAASDRVEALKVAYAEAGYGHGHRVGLLLENRPDHLFHWLALNALGASVVPISAEMRSAELEYLIGHAQLALAMVLPGRLEVVQKAAAVVGIETQVATADATRIPRPAAQAPLSSRPGLHSECALLYTSGTTGRPKGCRLSNDYFLHIGDWYTTLGGWCPVRPHEERIVTPLPMNHVNAMAFTAMAVITSGGCLIQLDRFHPKTWWKTVRTTRATICHYLGVMPAMLLGAEPSDMDRAHSLRWAFGAGVARQDHARFEERFGFPLKSASTASACRARTSKCAWWTTRARTCRMARRANCWCGRREKIPVATSSRAISRMNPPRKRPGRVAGSTPATSCAAKRRAACTSWIARRT